MKHLLSAILLLPLLFIACNSANEKEHAAEVTIEEIDKETFDNEIPAKQRETEAAATSDFLAASAQKSKQPASISATDTEVPVLDMDFDRKLIKTGNLKLEVKNYNAYSQKMQQLLRKYGAYIATEETFTTDDKTEAVLTIKVPVQFFEPLINELPGTDSKQVERSIATEEVTAQIVDTKARLETKKATRDKYVQFLKQGNKIEDVLKVQSEINNIQEDIESAESRLTHLTKSARYSTINLTFFEPGAGYTNDSPGYGSRMAAAFKAGGAWFANLFVVLMYIWPLYLAIFAGYFAFKVLRRQRLVKKVE